MSRKKNRWLVVLLTLVTTTGGLGLGVGLGTTIDVDRAGKYFVLEGSGSEWTEVAVGTHRTRVVDALVDLVASPGADDSMRTRELGAMHDRSDLDPSVRRAMGNAMIAASSYLDRVGLPAKVSLPDRLPRVQGLSAGLLYALYALDNATPGSLTNGRVHAATGVIHPNWAVGEISGIPAKVAAAKAAGATVMFVPTANFAEALAEAQSSSGRLDVVPVDDLVDAVRWLCVAGAHDELCVDGRLRMPGLDLIRLAVELGEQSRLAAGIGNDMSE